MLGLTALVIFCPVPRLLSRYKTRLQQLLHYENMFCTEHLNCLLYAIFEFTFLHL